MKDFNNFFDNIYKVYDQVRPGYPSEMFGDITDYKKLSAGSRIMELGIGTGKATQYFIDMKCQVASVEPGPKMAKFMRNKYKEYEDFSCYNMTFEKYMGMNNTFELIYGGNVFHWLDEKSTYEKAFKMLKPSGALARFNYHAIQDNSDTLLSDTLNELYKKYMPSDKEYRPFEEEDAKRISLIAEKYGFTDNLYKLYYFTKEFTADEYIKLLSTYPDHMAVEEIVRKEFFKEIKKAIKTAGDIIKVNYIVDLHLSRRP